MRMWIRSLLGVALASVLTVQPVAAITWNEAVGWVDVYRGSTMVASYWGVSACTSTACDVEVRVNAVDFRRLQSWGCTSRTYTIPAPTTYSQTYWRTLFTQCSGGTPKLYSARFYTRVDFLDATGTTQWVTVDSAVTVTIRVAAR